MVTVILPSQCYHGVYCREATTALGFNLRLFHCCCRSFWNILIVIFRYILFSCFHNVRSTLAEIYNYFLNTSQCRFLFMSNHRAFYSSTCLVNEHISNKNIVGACVRIAANNRTVPIFMQWTILPFMNIMLISYLLSSQYQTILVHVAHRMHCNVRYDANITRKILQKLRICFISQRCTHHASDDPSRLSIVFTNERVKKNGSSRDGRGWRTIYFVAI